MLAPELLLRGFLYLGRVRFQLYFNGSSYTPEAFLALQDQDPVLVRVRELIRAWNNDLPVTFTTSGSTGKPGIHSFSIAQIRQSAKATSEALGLVREEEHLLLCLDPKFVGGAMQVFRALELNCPLTVVPTGKKVWEVLPASDAITLASLSPAQLMQPEFDAKAYAAVKRVLLGGSGILPGLISRLEGLPNQTYHTYGMTETLSHIALRKLPEEPYYRVINPYSIRIGSSGTLCIRTPFFEGELVTNDIAEQLSEREFVLLGRSDFVINSGGIKVQPEQWEEWLSAMKDLPSGRWIISSRPHERWGQEVVLATETLWSDELMKAASDCIASHGIQQHLLKHQVLISPLPLTENGKPARRKVAEWLENKGI